LASYGRGRGEVTATPKRNMGTVAEGEKPWVEGGAGGGGALAGAPGGYEGLVVFCRFWILSRDNQRF